MKCAQPVYNANKLADILKKIEVLENWLQFSEIKFEKNPTRIPTIKVRILILRLCGSLVQLVGVPWIPRRQ